MQRSDRRVPPRRAGCASARGVQAPSGWCRTRPGMIARGARLPRRAVTRMRVAAADFGWVDRPGCGCRRNRATSALTTSGERVGAMDEAEHAARLRAAPQRCATQDFKQSRPPRHARRGDAASGDWLPRPSALEGRVHQHQVRRRLGEADAVAQRSRFGHVGRDQADAARRSAAFSRQASAPRAPKATRPASRSTPTTESAGGARRDGRRRPCRRPRRDRRQVRPRRTGRAPAAALRRARRGVPCAAARA